jgi:hypothetical protein
VIDFENLGRMDKFEIMALLKKEGRSPRKFPLNYSGQTNQFQALLPVNE